jgi:putative PEP-CTERM system histidine kinase
VARRTAEESRRFSSTVTIFSLVPFAAALASLLLALVRLLRRPLSPAGWCFCAGIVILGLESLMTGLGMRVAQPEDVSRWLTRAFIVKSFAPAAWLGFSLTYSRGDYRELLVRWRVPLVIVGVLPLVLALGFQDRLFAPLTTDNWWGVRVGPEGKALNAILLVALVVILMNMEQTLRAAAGTMRWRIKYVILAMAVIFGTHIFVRTQGILFSIHDLGLSGLESGALLIGCVFFAVAYARTGLDEIDLYPSRAVLRSSLTVLIVGGYLFGVGVLAQVVRRFGGPQIFQLQAFVVLLGMAGLAVLLLSDRARQKIHAIAARHFKEAQHDSVQIWTAFSRRFATVKDAGDLCAAAARLISETLGALSVTIWLVDEEEGRLVVGGSTAHPSAGVAGTVSAPSAAAMAGLRGRLRPFDLDGVNEPWAEELRRLNPTTFPEGGNRICVPMRAGDRNLGLAVLADRVGASVYTVEELELLNCIADQMTSVLLNLQLAGEVARSRELEAFRTMSAFFVHDLKNAAASLNLMLKNLPVHFDDAAFREDALRGIGNTARRIDEMIAGLSALRERRELAVANADLNELVAAAVESINGTPNLEVVRDLQPVPPVLVDRAQIQSVVTNLLLNARDAVAPGGRIQVRTHGEGDRVVLSVADNGCGMSERFVRESLFRPFQSTKKKGLGIGLFQAHAIVKAHGGGIHVRSEVGKGTTFLVSLPATGGKP